jgi:hypothetical protein
MTTSSNPNSMVAHFDLETHHFAVNKDKTKYSLLDNDGVSRCTNPLIDFVGLQIQFFLLISVLSVTLPFEQRIVKRNLFMEATIQIPSEMYEARGNHDGVSRCTNPLIDFVGLQIQFFLLISVTCV